MTGGQNQEEYVGIAERKEREKEERRSLILSTTRDLILEKGLATVTMVDIAKKCELSKAALYLYFPSKEAILSELFYASASYFLSYVSSKITEEDTGILAIRKLWMSYIEIFGESSDIIVLFGATNIISPEYPYVIDESPEGQKKEPFKLFRLIEEILARGVKDGTLDSSINPGAVARTIIMITGGIVENVARLPIELRKEKIILSEMKTTFEIVLRGVASATCDRSLLVLPID